MKIIKHLAFVLIALTLCISSSVTVFAANYYDQARYYSKEEIVETVWDRMEKSYYSTIANSTGNTFVISYMYEKLKQYVDELEMPDASKDYKISDVREDFEAYFIEERKTIIPYSEKVIDYLSEHPTSVLDIVFQSDSKQYRCNDKNINVDNYATTTYVKYDPDNLENLLYWTYDENTDKYICRDKNGKIKDSVTKYHFEGEADETDSSQSAEGSSLSDSSQEQSVIRDDQPVRPSDTSSVSAQTSAASVAEAAADTSEGNPGEAAQESTLSESKPESSLKPSSERETATESSAADEIAEQRNDNNTSVILIVIGVLIIAGIIVIILMLVNRKKEEQNDKGIQ